MRAQDSTGHWFFGIQGGTSLGQCTFRSITDDNSNLGGSAGIFGGYSFNPVLSLEAAASVGSMKLNAQGCDPYWLSDDENVYFAPVIDHNGDFYRNITAKDKFSKVALQLDIDILKLFTEPCNRFSLTVAPQISVINTKNKLSSDNYNQKFGSQTHFGYGAQVALGCFVAKKIEIQLFGGVTALTGDRFDNIPKLHHTSNHIFDAGIKIAYRAGRKCAERPTPPFADVTTDTTQNQPVVADNEIINTDTTDNQQVVVVDIHDIVNTSNADDNDQKSVVTEENNDNNQPKNDKTKRTTLPLIHFANNGLSIPQQEYPKFREIADYLKENPQMEISIYGYCSKTGTEEYNLHLSQRRADAIKHRLMQAGVAEERFGEVVGKGIDHSAPDNKSARRVEIIVE